MYKIITTKGLERQVLLKDEAQLDERRTPAESLGKSLIEIMKEDMAVDNKAKPVFVGYDNTIVGIPRKDERFPVVSMAHFFLADTLKDMEEVRNSNNKRIYADMGCGAGFLGNYIAKNFFDGKHGKIIFADLFPESLQAAFNAYLINNDVQLKDLKQSKTYGGLRFEDPRNGDDYLMLDFKLGDIQKSLVGDSHIDIAVASPIYIPEICENFPQAYQIFGSVSKQQGADFYFSHSSLSDRVVEAAAEATGAKLIGVRSEARTLDAQTADSRNGSTMSEETVEKLIPLGLQIIGTNNPIYGHELRVSKMEY